MKNENLVRLKILSTTLRPEEIAGRIGLAPDSSWVLGDRKGQSMLVHKDNGWVLKSTLPPNQGLDNHVASVLERIALATSKVRELSDTCTVEFSCVIYSQEPPALNFNPKVIDQISSLGASLDIDLYLGQ